MILTASTRSFEDMAKVGGVDAREPDVVERDARDHALTSTDIISAMLSDRSEGSEVDMQARSWLTDILQMGEGIMGHFLKRDPAGEKLATRSNFDGLMEVLNARRNDIDDLLNHLSTREPSTQKETQARSIATDGSTEIMARTANDFLTALLNSRDSPMDELAGRDIIDDLFNHSIHPPREPSPQQETQARRIPDSSTIMARDNSATSAFIKALLSSRESSGDITPDNLLTLASLASRALDELD